MLSAILITFCSVISADELYKSFKVYKTFMVSSMLTKSPFIVNSFPFGYMETLNLFSNISRCLSSIPHTDIKEALSLNFTLLSKSLLLIILSPFYKFKISYFYNILKSYLLSISTKKNMIFFTIIIYSI